jgi:hypothetical protein
MRRMKATYLYGDSTPCPLSIDLVGLLPGAIDFAVHVLRADSTIREAMQKLARLGEATDRDIDGAQALVADVLQMIERDEPAPRTAMASRCATAIRPVAIESLRSETVAARAAVANEAASVAELTAGERQAVARAFETLAVRSELPDATETLEVALEGDGYRATLQTRTAYGLTWATRLAVPASHPLASPLRLDRITDHIEIEALEIAGWFRKDARLRMQRLDRHYLSLLRVEADAIVVGLRSAANSTGAGFDLVFGTSSESARVVRVVEGGVAEEPYEVAATDASTLGDFRDQLVAMGRGLLAHKLAVLAPTLDGTPLAELPAPRILVERLIASLAPHVREVGRRSLTPGELVQKRQTGENQREELFVSRGVLKAKIAKLEPPLRSVFELLGLDEPPPAAPQPPSSEEAAAATERRPVTVPPPSPGRSFTDTMPLLFTPSLESAYPLDSDPELPAATAER